MTGYPNSTVPTGYIPIDDTVTIGDIEDRLDFLETDAAIVRASLYEAAGEARAAAQAALAAIRALGYAATGDPDIDTPAIKAMIATAVAGGISTSMTVYNACGLRLLPGQELDVSGLAPNSGLAFLGPITRYWTPTVPDGNTGPDLSLSGWIKGTGTAAGPCAPGFRLTWVSVDYSPRVTWEGFVTAVDTDPVTGHFDVQMKAGFEPAFTTMRVFHKIENDVWTYSQSEERGSAPGISYPVVSIGGGVYRVTPTVDTLTITGFSSLDPLTVMGTMLDSERTYLASGFTGPDAANINGHTYTFDLEQGSSTRGVLLENGQEVTATGWNITGYGVLTSPRIPSWVTVNSELVGVCRKRGTPEIDPRYHKDWTVGPGLVKMATAVFFAGAFGENVTIDNVTFRGDGRMSGTAGGIVTIEHRGPLKIKGIDGYGLGDDTSNQTPRYWNKFLSANTSTTVTIDTTRVWLPRLTDKVLFISPTKVRTLVPITAVNATVPTATVVTLAVPVGFDPLTWTVRNDAVQPEVRMTNSSAEGGSRAFFFQTGKGSAVSTRVRNTRGPAFRSQDPKSGAHSSSGAYAAGLKLGAWDCYRTCMTYVSTYSCATFVSRVQGSTTPSGLPADVFGAVVSINFGFMFAIAEGVDQYFASVFLQNSESQRGTGPTAGDATLPGNFDFVAIAATQTVANLNADALTWVKIKTLYGGNVVIGNRGALGELAATNADAAVRTLAYNRLRNTITLTAPRTFTLGQLGAQSGDAFEIVNDGTGQMIIKDETTGTTLGTVNAGQSAFARNNGTRWS